MRIAPETVYQWVYREAGNAVDLHLHLRFHHKKRRKQRRYGTGRGLIPGRVGIQERPGVVGGRTRIGDWEGNLVVGKGGAGAVLTLLERKSRYLLACKLASKHADPAARAMTALLRGVPKIWRQTMTLDNGKEFASFKYVEKTPALQLFSPMPTRPGSVAPTRTSTD